jgi:hypothetical protein
MDHNPFARLSDHWEDILSDMEATADEYREQGWETMELHPGDVTALAPDEEDDTYGLDVLVPGDEFDELEARVEGGASFDSYQVFRGEGSGLVLLLVVMEDEESELAALFPAYFDPGQSTDMREAALSSGTMYSHVRPLDKRNVVTFAHDDPALFFDAA